MQFGKLISIPGGYGLYIFDKCSLLIYPDLLDSLEEAIVIGSVPVGSYALSNANYPLILAPMFRVADLFLTHFKLKKK